MKPRRAGEDGYALIAAVASIAVFGLLALMIVEASSGTIVATGAELDRARAIAAAEAGAAIVLQGLLQDDVTRRWPIDGRARREAFDGAALTLRVEDERGKIPINALEDADVVTVFEGLGLSGERLAVASDSLLDWIDDDDYVRSNGAEAAYYQKSGIRPRNRGLLSLGEAGLIRGIDPALVSRLSMVATVNFGRGTFDPRYASPLAIRVMLGDSGAVSQIERERELAGQRTALELAKSETLVGRPLTIVVDAELRGGARATQRTLVELTGARRQPYVVLARD